MANVKTTNFTFRIDTEKKLEAEKLFADLGLTLSSAFNIFLNQCLMTQGLPFAVRREKPNKTTLAAIQEAIQFSNDPNAQTYSSVDELMTDLEK